MIIPLTLEAMLGEAKDGASSLAMSSELLPTLMQAMVDLLPSHPTDVTTSDLSTSYEAVALLAHAYMVVLGFQLCGLDEANPMLVVEKTMSRLPSSWNDGFGAHSFVYSNIISPKLITIRVDRMGGKFEVRGVAAGDDEILRFEKLAREYVNSASLPVRITRSADGAEDRSDKVGKMRKLFVSDAAIQELIQNLTDLVRGLLKSTPETMGTSDVRVEPLRASPTAVPQLTQESGPMRYSDAPIMSGPGHPAPPPAGRFPGNISISSDVRPPAEFLPPGFDDELDINRPPSNYGPLVLPGRSQAPFNIGYDDLNPPDIGGHNNLLGSILTPGSGLPRPGGGMGMHPTFDDPLFAGSGTDQPGFGGSVPPGARYDPLGPGGPRFPQSGGRGGSHPFGGNFGGGYL